MLVVVVVVVALTTAVDAGAADVDVPPQAPNARGKQTAANAVAAIAIMLGCRFDITRRSSSDGCIEGRNIGVGLLTHRGSCLKRRGARDIQLIDDVIERIDEAVSTIEHS